MYTKHIINLISILIISQLLISCQNNNSEYINQIEKLENELEECADLVQEADSIKQVEEAKKETNLNLNNTDSKNTKEKESVPKQEEQKPKKVQKQKLNGMYAKINTNKGDILIFLEHEKFYYLMQAIYFVG